MELFCLGGWLEQSDSNIVYALQRIVFHDMDDSESFPSFSFRQKGLAGALNW